ncbi:MAG: iron ABC transporter permease [Oscillospiraceae bacterium]|nr:iron ABC transporter permease [Oscillospiraceae bacterium]
MKKRMVVLLILLPVAAAVVSLFVGRYLIPPQDVLFALFPFLGETSAENLTVVRSLRLPRIIAAAFVGAALSASGTAFQGVFHNPLVSSGLLGVSAGAGFGAALSILIFSVTWASYPFAFLFGLAAVALSYWVARIYKTAPAIMLVLGGTVVSAIFNALISLLKYVADTDRQLPAIVYWLMGSLASVRYQDFWALIPVGAGLVILLLFAWDINVLSMGDRQAKALGVNVRAAKTWIIAGATFATAGAVCLSGVVGWVGLVIPHIGRFLVGNDNRRLLPVSMLVGAGFMIVIDTVSRVIVASEVPLGILTALIGAPFFIYLLKRKKGGGWQA